MSTTTIRLAIQAVSELPLVHQQLSKLIELTEQAKTVTQQAAQQAAYARADELRAMRDVQAAIVSQTTAYKQGSDEGRKRIDDQIAGLKTLQDGFSSLKSYVIASLSLEAFKQFTNQVIDAKSKVDIFQNALTQMIGSRVEANTLFVELGKMAVNTPFNVDQLLDTTLKLKALGVATQDLMPTVTMLGDIAATVGADKLPRLTKAFTDVQAKQKLYAAETKQFAELGVDIYQALADSMDKPRAAVVKMGEAHEITFAQVKKALQDATAQGGLYYGQMTLASTTLAGQTSNLADKFFLAKARIGDFFENGLKQSISGMADLMQMLTGSNAALQRTIDFIKSATLGWTSYALLTNRAAIAEGALAAAATIKNGVMAAGQLVVGTYNLVLIAAAGTTDGFTAAQVRSAAAARSTWAALAANPLLTIIATVGLAVAAWQAYEAVTRDVTKAAGDAELQLRTEQTTIQNRIESAMKLAQSDERRKAIIQSLIQQYPDYFAGLNAEKTSNAQLKGIMDTVNASLERRISLARQAYNQEVIDQKLKGLFKTQDEIMRLAEERLGKEFMISVNYDPAKLQAALAKSEGHMDQFIGNTGKGVFGWVTNITNQASDAFNTSLPGSLRGGITASLTALNKGFADVKTLTEKSIGDQKYQADENLAYLMAVEDKRYKTVVEQQKKIIADSQAAADDGDKKAQAAVSKAHSVLQNALTDHQKRMADIEGTGQAAIVKIASDGAEKYKTITVQTAAQIALEKAAQNQQTYKEKLAYLDKEEKAEIESVNKIRVAKDASDAEIAKATEVAQDKINGIIKTYQDKRVELSRNEWLKISEVIEQANKGLEEGEIQRLTIQTEGIKGAKERAKEYTELSKQTAQIEKEAARDITQTQNERFKIEEQSRRKLFALVLDFASQESGLVGQMGRAAKAVFDNWDAISGKSKENAEQRVRETETLFNAAQARLTFLMDFGTGEQIQKQKQVVAGAKVTAEEAKTELEKVTASSQQAMAGLLSLGFQAFVALGKAVDEQIQAQRQAQADAFREFRDIHRGFYNWLIDASKEAYKQELESFSRGYDEKRTIIERFYEYQGELMKNRDGVDAQLAQVQEILDAKGDARALMRNSEQDQMAFEKAHLETRLKQIELEKQRLTDLHDAKLSQISEEFEARRDQINAEIDAAKDAFETKKDLIEQERDKKKEAIEDQLSALKDSYDQQKALAQQQYDDAVQKVNDRYDAERQQLQDTYDFRRSLVEQSKADELEAAGIIDRLRDDVLERYRTTEVDKLTAQRDRILAGNLSEKERADVMNAFAERIGQVHKDVEDAKLDKSKANTIISKQLKQEEKDLTEKLKEEETNKIIELETRQKNEITDLKTQLKTTLDTYRQDFETKERELKGRISDLEVDTKNKIEALQTELRNTITGYQNQLRDNELDAAHKKELANRAYIGAVRQAQAEAFEANKQISIIELRIAVLKLRAAGAAQGLIDQVNAMISELGGVSGPAAYGTPVVVNPSGGIGGAYAAAQDVASKRGSDDVYRGWFTSDGAPVEVFYNPNDNKVITVYDAAKNPIQLRNADGYVPSTGKRFAQGTEYVDGPYPTGVDTIPAMLNRGERVIPTEQNAMLGNISNTELIARMLQPRLSIPVLPARLNLPDTVGMSGGSSAVLAELRELRRAVADKELLQLHIDNGGIAAAMIAQDQKTTYHANRFQF